MTRSEGDRDLANGLDAVAALAREATPPMTPLQRMRGLQAITQRQEAARQRRRTRFVAASLSACAIVVGVGLFAIAPLATHGRISLRALRHGPSPRTGVQLQAAPPLVSANADVSPLSYRVDHGEIGDGGYLRSSGDGAGVGLHFAEGTELHLAAGARGRLTSVDGQGARFAIEQGQALVNVVPRAGARWLIDAGPFLITVHGTIFTAAWDGASEQLDISMTHGLVSVTGPVADGKIAVRAGQRLTINVPARQVVLRPTDDAEAAAAAASAGTGTGTQTEPSAAAEAPPAVVGPRPRARVEMSRGAFRSSSPAAIAARASAPARRWTAARAAGDFQSILQDAEHRGLRRSLSEAHSEDLAALADAARYLRREDVARQALMAQRERFPRTERAHEAAFFLGRLTETGAAGDVRALGWYNRYLGEAPTGAYASEALGRKMTATEKLKGLAAARDIAVEYLRRFPHGTYAGAAQALSETP